MSEIKKKWFEVVTLLNFSSQVSQRCEQSLQAIQKLEKTDKSKEELKKEIEQNIKLKPILEEQQRVYSAIVKAFSSYADIHTGLVEDINIEYALETEVTPAKDGNAAVKKLVLDEKGAYCYDKTGEKGRAKALRELSQSEVFVKQLTIATTLQDDEKPDLLQGFILFEKSKVIPLKSVSKKK